MPIALFSKYIAVAFGIMDLSAHASMSKHLAPRHCKGYLYQFKVISTQTSFCVHYICVMGHQNTHAIDLSISQELQIDYCYIMLQRH